MTKILCVIIGMMIGGCLAALFMCCLQINRINEYEAEISGLKAELNKESEN